MDGWRRSSIGPTSWWSLATKKLLAAHLRLRVISTSSEILSGKYRGLCMSSPRGLSERLHRECLSIELKRAKFDIEISI
jgi:hypothetical protein